MSMSKKRQRLAAAIQKDFSQPDKTDLSKLKSPLMAPQKKNRSTQINTATFNQTDDPWQQLKAQYHVDLKKQQDLLSADFRKIVKTLGSDALKVYIELLYRSWLADESYCATPMSQKEVQQLIGCSRARAKKIIQELSNAHIIQKILDSWKSRGAVWQINPPEKVVKLMR